MINLGFTKAILVHILRTDLDTWNDCRPAYPDLSEAILTNSDLTGLNISELNNDS